MINSAAQDFLQQAADLILSAEYFVAFTGAGISTPSGIPDFRSAGSGLWTQSDPLEVASLTAFRSHPERFFNWLRPLAQQIGSAQPNPAHLALAQLEQAKRLKAVITQNIDGLHQRAGSQKVIEVHGSMSTLQCPHCRSAYSSEPYYLPFVVNNVLPRCPKCQALLKPDITLFEELLPAAAWENALEHSQAADCYMVVGSSLEVSPANGLPHLAYQNGAKIIISTLSPTYLDRKARLVIRADAAKTLPAIVERVIQGSSSVS